MIKEKSLATYLKEKFGGIINEDPKEDYIENFLITDFQLKEKNKWKELSKPVKIFYEKQGYTIKDSEDSIDWVIDMGKGKKKYFVNLTYAPRLISLLGSVKEIT